MSVSSSKSTSLPPGSWDSHVHVVDEEAFPFAQDHAFRPKKATLEDLLKFEEGLGTDHVCLVAISVYGTDNELLLRSLRELKGKGRAVVSIDPETTSDQDLDEMHALGVRGIRINLKSTSQNKSKEELITTLRSYVRKVDRLQWAIQLHIGLADIEKIASEIPTLGVPVVIDHLATPEKTLAPRLQPGYTAFMELLSKKQVWVKLSGIYRFAELPELDTYVREILRIAPTQVVWASDWPHTGGVAANPQGDRHALQEYRKFDVPSFIAQCKEWCEGDEALIQKIFVDNPRRLWQYEGQD
ncbi:MAG: hypothetical protein ALECFALPRED_004737 [Alectoria fallacina]|uniref:Amidohydrolase-related domain-containing protein n=1 Tax=Alectoria fallacina TaxID=1903189 RepID=A0A8H3IT29_9LECA|nr:MAG: hypothetical protein ALECFALPRED_004737 [Alectoria fallacina]